MMAAAAPCLFLQPIWPCCLRRLPSACSPLAVATRLVDLLMFPVWEWMLECCHAARLVFWYPGPRSVAMVIRFFSNLYFGGRWRLFSFVTILISTTSTWPIPKLSLLAACHGEGEIGCGDTDATPRSWMPAMVNFFLVVLVQLDSFWFSKHSTGVNCPDITRLLRLAHVIKYGKAIYHIFSRVWRLFHRSIKGQPRTLVMMRMYPVGNSDKQAILP